MDDKDLTPWLDRKAKPKRIGIYQRDFHGPIWYSYWNGSYWGQLCAFYELAVKYRLERSKHQELPWRGYSRNPE